MPTQRFATALKALKTAYDEATALISEQADHQQAFENATDLANMLRDLAQAASTLRATTVARIAEQEKLSLAVLAERIGISKARAAQLVTSATKLAAKDRPKES